MIEINKVYNENCIDTMDKMGENFVDLVVTSPPYDGLRDYKGYSFDFERVAKGLYSVMKEGGVVVWVVGDATVKGSETGTSFAQALYFKSIGFLLHDTMIYEKPSRFPSGCKSNRYSQEFEYMFIFSKNISPKYVNLIRDKKNKYSGLKIHGSIRKKNGEMVKATKGDENKFVNELGVRTNIWRYATGYGNSSKDDVAFDHPAIFPEALVADNIKSWSKEGDLVYDPFMGSGTTAKMSLLTNRNYIGSEISNEYCDIIEKRMNMYKNNLFKI